jgi:rubrerythrin
MADFNIERFMELSKRVDLSDVDWDKCAQIGLTDEEVRVLKFMSDTETHTIIYLRDLLAGHTAQDVEVISFLSCWVYEETFHGRALDKILETCGKGAIGSRYNEVTKPFSWREEMTGALSRFGATMSPHFAAAHMCWGAINEATAAASYMALARRTKNTELAKIVTKLAKDERKHFSFYFHQCEKRLKSGGWKARWLCDTTIRRFWKPVGIGVGEPRTLEFVASYMFGDERGKADLKKADDNIKSLPGMEWFNMTAEWQSEGQEWYRLNEPEKYAQHREWERTIWAAPIKDTEAAAA